MKNNNQREKPPVVAGKIHAPVVKNRVPTRLLENARQLRKRQTRAEDFLWELLRNRGLQGLKFRRQHPIHDQGSILDFFCAKTRLAIELDGAGHQEKGQKAYDAMRTELLKEYGIRVLRFTNAEVINETVRVLSQILDASADAPEKH